MKEYWKDIEGYEGLYQISNLGRVKSFYSGKVLKEAAETLNLHPSNLTNVLKGRYKQTGGFYFEYAE